MLEWELFCRVIKHHTWIPTTVYDALLRLPACAIQNTWVVLEIISGETMNRGVFKREALTLPEENSVFSHV